MAITECDCSEVLLSHVRLFRCVMDRQFIFMDDNVTPHRTVDVTLLLESEDIQRMDSPARSPDLNRTKHVWDILWKRLSARHQPPATIPELRFALQEVWTATPQQLTDNLALSMDRRCKS